MESELSSNLCRASKVLNRYSVDAMIFFFLHSYRSVSKKRRIKKKKKFKVFFFYCLCAEIKQQLQLSYLSYNVKEHQLFLIKTLQWSQTFMNVVWTTGVVHPLVLSLSLAMSEAMNRTRAPSGSAGGHDLCLRRLLDWEPATSCPVLAGSPPHSSPPWDSDLS